MKKFAYVIAALAAAFAVSCTKETPLDTPNTDAPAEVGMKEVTITASIDPETKTSYDVDGKFSWTAGDQISIKGSDNVFYTFTATESAESSTFTGMIPEGVSLQKHALYPANELNAQNGDGSYAFCLPEYKDLTGCSSAEIPMSSYVSSGVYNFKHMTGAALLTFNNIPDQFVSVEITVKANSVRLSGILKLWSGSPFSWSSATAQNDSEKTFTRKVSVNNNQAELYLPYRGEFWDNCTINIVGFDAEGNTGVLLKDKTMKGSSENVYNPGLVILYAPLVLNNLNNVDWENALTTTVDPSAEYPRLKELKVATDKYFMYTRLCASLADTYEGDYLDIFLSDGNGATEAWYGWSTLGANVYNVGLGSHKGAVAPATGNLTAMKFMQGDTQVNLDVVSNVAGEDAYWYIVVPRNYLEPYTNNGKVYVSFMLWKSWTPYGVIPTLGTSMLEVTLP